MDDALHLAHLEYFTASHGSRSAALKVVIVVTDGEKYYNLMYIYSLIGSSNNNNQLVELIE